MLRLIIGNENPGRKEKVVCVEKSEQIDMKNFSAEMFGVGNEGFALIKHDFEQMQDDLIDGDCFQSDPDIALTYKEKQQHCAFYERHMKAFEGKGAENMGTYLAFAWALLKVQEAPLKEYTPEELSRLTPSEVIDYRRLFPKEKSDAIHNALMAYYNDRDFFKDVDWVIEKCDAVKQKYGADCKLALELVKTALLKGILEEG